MQVAFLRATGRDSAGKTVADGAPARPGFHPAARFGGCRQLAARVRPERSRTARDSDGARHAACIKLPEIRHEPRIPAHWCRNGERRVPVLAALQDAQGDLPATIAFFRAKLANPGEQLLSDHVDAAAWWGEDA